MKRHIIASLIAAFVLVGCVGPQGNKHVDQPRAVRYPLAGKVDVNKEPVYWLKKDGEWVKVSEAEYQAAR